MMFDAYLYEIQPSEWTSSGAMGILKSCDPSFSLYGLTLNDLITLDKICFNNGIYVFSRLSGNAEGCDE